MNIPANIPYPGGSYHPFSRIGTGSGGEAAVYRALHTPTDITALKTDYPFNSHRMLKILSRTEGNGEVFEEIVDDNRNILFTHPKLITVERCFIHSSQRILRIPRRIGPNAEMKVIYNADFVIAMEDMCGSIHDLLRTRQNLFGIGLPAKMVCFVLREVLEGLSFIHSEGLLHESLDTWSVFYSTKKYPAIKLNCWAGDFDMGILRHLDRRVTGNIRTTKKIECPETRTLIQHPYTPMSDVWHLGLMAIEMSLGLLETLDNKMADELIGCFRKANDVAQPMGLNMAGSSISFPNMQVRGRLMKKSMGITILSRSFSPLFVNFVVECTRGLPQERPDANILLNHPLFEAYLIDESEIQRALSEAHKRLA
ncbi:hypothetical protein ACET3Z_017581 [Daucus carota]